MWAKWQHGIANQLSGDQRCQTPTEEPKIRSSGKTADDSGGIRTTYRRSNSKNACLFYGVSNLRSYFIPSKENEAPPLFENFTKKFSHTRGLIREYFKKLI